MKILVLAPHPYYQERGTPIAVDLLIKALSERGDSVDLLTFHEGIDREYEGLRICRISPIPNIKNLRPGFSSKKIYCDIFMFFRLIILLLKNRYDVVHAVEESAFMALLTFPIRSIPFVYDIDSSMTTQIIDRLRFLRPLEGILRFFESLPMRYASAVVPMCDALADDARRNGAQNVVVLKDVSLIDQSEIPEVASDLRGEINITGKILMYIGNLESYQGIDLLLVSFAKINKATDEASLVVIGGIPKHVEYYRECARSLGISKYVYFLGPRPVTQIGGYMKQADVLVSPRTQGANTPMKIYSYLDSGVAVLATRLPTHTQVMTDEISMLAAPEANDFSQAMIAMLDDTEMCTQLAKKAKLYIKKEHSYAAFRDRVHGLYDDLEKIKKPSSA